MKRLPYARAIQAQTTHRYDYVTPYVADLQNVVDLAAVARAGIKIGVDPMGGARSTTGRRLSHCMASISKWLIKRLTQPSPS